MDEILNIGVVIPTYNRAAMIEKAIRSVMEQEGDGELFIIDEICIVDDGSADETESVIADIADKRIRYHRLDKNQGASHARNTGVALLKSEWIAFQDSDDIWAADKLKKQVMFLREHNDYKMVIHPIRARLSGGRYITTVIPKTDDQYKELVEQNFAGTPAMLINREVFLKKGGFDESMKALEDWDFALRFSFDNKIGVVNEALLQADMEIEGVSANMANYYDGRCRMIVNNKELMMKKGCFEKATESLLMHAQENGVLQQVGKMLEYYLSYGTE